MQFNFSEGNQYVAQVEKYVTLLEIYGPRRHESDLVLKALSDGLISNEEAVMLMEWVCRFPVEIGQMRETIERRKP